MTARAGQVSRCQVREVFHVPLSLLSVSLSRAGLLAVKGMDDVMPELLCCCSKCCLQHWSRAAVGGWRNLQNFPGPWTESREMKISKQLRTKGANGFPSQGVFVDFQHPDWKDLPALLGDVKSLLWICLCYHLNSVLKDHLCRLSTYPSCSLLVGLQYFWNVPCSTAEELLH